MWSAFFLVMLVNAGGDPPSHPDLDNAAQVISRMSEAEHRQERELCRYTVQRRYTIRNRHLEPNAGMSVSMRYEAGSGKHFTITSSEHLGTVSLRVLRDLMKDEEEASREPTPRSQLIPQRYSFTLEGIETRNGRRCYRIGLKPKERNKYLIDGVAWIDTAEFALVRVEGHSAKSLSFWLGSPLIEQDFEKVGRFWVRSHNRSVAQVKLAGETELHIDSFNYQFPTPVCPGSVPPGGKQ